MPDLPDEQLIRKRTQVGVIAIVCLAVSLAAAVTGDLETAWASSLMRIGLVLGALWLALPTRTRPAAWANFSKWWIAGAVAFAVLYPRIKPILPLLLFGILIGWLLRPRRRR